MCLNSQCSQNANEKADKQESAIESLKQFMICIKCTFGNGAEETSGKTNFLTGYCSTSECKKVRHNAKEQYTRNHAKQKKLVSFCCQ